MRRTYIHTQGYDGGPVFPSRARARKEIRHWLRVAIMDCRRKFGTALVIKPSPDVWEVRPMRDPRGPLWLRFSIHDG